MDFLPQKKTLFKAKTTGYLPGQESICIRRLTLKIIQGIEIPYNKTNKNATYNKANKSNLFVTVFAGVPAPDYISSSTGTLIRANALDRHSTQNLNTVIEHCEGHCCTMHFESVYHRDKSLPQSGLYRDYTVIESDSTMTAKTRAMLRSRRPY